jgi:ferredoxin
MIREQCEKHTPYVRLINLTGRKELLFENNRRENLYKALGEYDLLFIGGPVYAGHMERNVLKTISILPYPDDLHSNLAILFLTYGGVHSSIAMEEMGTLLDERRYKSMLGIKIAAMHTLTKTFAKVINPGKPGREEEELIIKAVVYIFETIGAGKKNMIDQRKSFEYSSTKERDFFHGITQEELHEKYKTVCVDQSKCIKCKKCIKGCPVNMFDFVENRIEINKNNNRCILCAECYHNCPVNAISYPYIEIARVRLKDGSIPMESPLSAVYPDIF